MRVFISFASEDRLRAERLHFALVGAGLQTFFDHESLPPGGDFNSRIQSGVQRSDLFIFLISPDSVASGCYALTELGYARRKWSHPKGRVLPVMLRSVPIPDVPPYLSSVTVLEPIGNPEAEVALAVATMASALSRRRWLKVVGAAVAALILTVGSSFVYMHMHPGGEHVEALREPLGRADTLPSCLAGQWKEQYENPAAWTFEVQGQSIKIERLDKFISGTFTRQQNQYVGELHWGNGDISKNVILTPTDDCSQVRTNQSWWYHR